MARRGGLDVYAVAGFGRLEALEDRMVCFMNGGEGMYDLVRTDCSLSFSLWTLIRKEKCKGLVNLALIP